MQVVLGWMRHHGAIAIPKTQSDVRMRENLKPCTLDAAVADALDAMDPPPPGFDPARLLPPAPPEGISTAADTPAAPEAIPSLVGQTELEGATALLEVVSAVVQPPSAGQPSASTSGCAWFADVSPQEMIGFARSELDEVETELATFEGLQRAEQGGEKLLRARVSWEGEETAQDEGDACCRRLEAELGDVLFDASHTTPSLLLHPMLLLSSGLRRTCADRRCCWRGSAKSRRAAVSASAVR